jgi:HK97 family phage major capsid protein
MQTVAELTQEIRAGKKAGHNFGAYIQALAYGARKGGITVSLAWAQKNLATRPLVIDALKAAVAAGTGTDTSWAGPLVLPKPLAAEFVNLLVPLTILDRAGFRRVPFNVLIQRILTGASAGWVSEGNPIPVSAGTFDAIRLGYFKMGSISLITDELATFAHPDAQALIAADAARAFAQFADTQLLDPSVALVANQNPASLTHGAHQIASTGATPAEVQADIKNLFDYFLSNGIPLNESVLILSEATATAWAALVGTSGNPVWPGLNGVQGGQMGGVQVLVSAFALNTATLVHADSVIYADGGVNADVSEESAVQADGAPSNSASVNTSLWQENLVGIRSIRYLNWLTRRQYAVATITGVSV